jgi:hypothetical protein
VLLCCVVASPVNFNGLNYTGVTVILALLMPVTIDIRMGLCPHNNRNVLAEWLKRKEQ